MERTMKINLEKLVHDVRNPLNSISVNAELVKVLIDQPDSSAQVKKALDTILLECRKCNEVLNSSQQYFSE